MLPKSINALVVECPVLPLDGSAIMHMLLWANPQVHPKAVMVDG